MCQWTADSQRLILEHFDMICDSPSYIYNFALPICPLSSWLHQYYSIEFSQEIKVVKGVSAGWGSSFRTVWFNQEPWVLACWKDTIAVGGKLGSIIILNAITGVQVAILSGHTNDVHSLVFSSDGASLVSGGRDKTIKLWDIQTGGVVKTFQGHSDYVYSVSISADHTMIASASQDWTIRLWDIQTGECHHTIRQRNLVNYVHFFPLDPKHFMSIYYSTIQEWDTSGQKIAPEYKGSCIAFSPDGTQFVVCDSRTVKVQSSDSKGIVAEFTMSNEHFEGCCFSPDNKVVAACSGDTIYVWDIAGSEPHLLETFKGHTGKISSLVFSFSSLISASYDCSVKFWQIGTSSTDPVLADSKCISSTSASIKSITLQGKDGIAISSHSDGMVRIWDILTGLCKTSFQTPAKGCHQMDTRLTDGRVISVWHTYREMSVWDNGKGELLRTVDMPSGVLTDLRISGDGSKFFCLYRGVIEAWSIWTGDLVGEVHVSHSHLDDYLLTIDGLKPRVYSVPTENKVVGWDFGVLGSSPVQLPDTSQNLPHLYFIGGIRRQKSFIPGIQNTATKKIVFQLPGRLVRCSDAQWDGHYLVAGYDSGEILILECNYVPH